ncbi:uncharacterized protein LOC133297410 [Gastrolobium bilobum]|uniref:uncharacterized protein LOC133297410 n=1 Tax=Gastrolobium bilobum TaxID=150636 RepID=UPI002AB0D29E|nr:uncharacterized protein LOC133297410 [Gastrolobium bilobum]
MSSGNGIRRGNTPRGISRGRGRPQRVGRATSSSPQLISSQPSPPTSRLRTPTPDPITESTEDARQVVSPSPLPSYGAESSAAIAGSHPVWGSTDPTDKKIWICPLRTTFEPSCVNREIMPIIKGNFDQSCESYGNCSVDMRDLWYEKFLQKYKCLPHDENMMKKTFDSKASTLLSHHLHRIRNGQEKDTWIKDDAFANIKEIWSSDEWQKKSQKNKQNRACFEGASHVGGSIPFSEHKKRLMEDPAIDPNSVDWLLYEMMHIVKKDGSWTSQRSKEVADKFFERRNEHDMVIGNDASTGQSDNELFLQTVGGMSKKGRIFGLDSEASKYKASQKSASSCQGVSANEYNRMRDLVTTIST